MKHFTKSRFKLALECPSKLYYERHPDIYANQALEDEFLASLAEGGFQVGELAKLYYDIMPDSQNNIRTLDTLQAVAITKELLKQENVNIAEAAFLYDKMLVRVDILEKRGNSINIIEVKAKSWNPNKDKFIDSKGNVSSGIRPYVYDVAFQKYVVEKALTHDIPETKYAVKAFLMMADKSRTTDVNCLNQLFRIVEKNSRTMVELEDGAIQAIADSKTRILRAFDVDAICYKIIAGETNEQKEYMGTTFVPFVESAKSYYLNDVFAGAEIGAKCFKCQFYTTDKDKCNKLSGYEECWRKNANFTDADFKKPLIKDLWGLYINRGNWIKNGAYFLSDINDDMLNFESQEDGLHHKQRKWLQIALATNNKDKLALFSDDIADGVYFDKDGFRREASSWTYPLHLIDFETSAVALPFYKGMRPYEQVAFQFSHHILNADGSIEHKGQYINTKRGFFPNFEFVREFKKQLEVDNGTIFRYATHENSILREIYRQLEAGNEPDRQELMDFIDEITHDGKKHIGSRDMVDLLEIVKKYYYHPSMKGSNSIKDVLPAVLNSSEYLQDKYKERIYGSVIKSLTISPDEPIAWVQFDEAGGVVNPYKTLPPIASYITENIAAQKALGSDKDSEEVDGDSQVNNGGLALSAYSKMQFSNVSTESRVALSKALLRYCELDTMAMVFIIEYFLHASV